MSSFLYKHDSLGYLSALFKDTVDPKDHNVSS